MLDPALRSHKPSDGPAREVDAVPEASVGDKLWLCFANSSRSDDG